MQSSLQFEGAWSLGTSKRGKWVNPDHKLYPGAGAYKPNLKHMSTTGDIKFPQGPRQDLADKRGFPGPGTYDQQTEDNYKYNKIQFGKIYKFAPDNNYPGPPTYQPKYQATKQSKPSFTMSYKHPKEIISTTPAPNHYPNEENQKLLFARTQESWLRKTNTSGFGTSPQRQYDNPNRRLDVRRKISQPHDNPGPGEYIQHTAYSTKGKGWSIGRGLRTSYGGDGQPAPNHYVPKTNFFKTTNGFSMGSKLDNGMKRYETCSPGPVQDEGRLAIKDSEKNRATKAISFPKDESNYGGIIKTKVGDEPGPGHYDQIPIQYQSSHLKSTSIGLSERPDLNIAAQQNVPGPGTYFSETDQQKQGPAYVMGAKLKDRKKYHSMTPGPGQYHIFEQQQNPQSYSVTQGPRSDPTKSSYPNVGPNSYNINAKAQKIGQKYSIGKASRFANQKKTYEPGPGSYDLGGTIGKIPEYLLLSKKKNTGLLDF